MTEEYRTLLQRTIDNLKEAQRQIQRAQRSIGATKSFKTLNSNERKLLDKVNMSMFDPIDNIQCVVDALNITLK